MQHTPTTPSLLLIAALALSACKAELTSATAPGGFKAAVGVERVAAFTHAAGGAHVGVDAIRRPRRDAATGEWRDDHLLVSACATGIYAALVDDAWQQRAEAFWPVPGVSLPWSDLKVVRHVNATGTERVLVYHCSRGTNLLQITDVTAFPTVHTVTVPIDLGQPVAVRGAHTLQVHERRGVLVLNGIDIGAEVPPAPLTYGSAPAAFYDIATDPMAPRLLSVFAGESAGDQVMFDSQFLHLDGVDIWAPTISQPVLSRSFFSFYEFGDAAQMANPRKLADYEQPISGQAHNVVQMPPRPDGTPLLAAGFEAWAFASQPGEVIAKAAVLDMRALLAGTAPQFVAYLHDDHNQRHAVHNPCSRLHEIRTHTFDTVPLAHFTGGYFVYEYGAATAAMLAHVPISSVGPSGRFGRRHDSMTVPVWMAGYNGAWDMVATWIGDYVSCTDRETSYLIEPTHGFVRQFGTYLPQHDGTVPRVHVSGPVPQLGGELRLRVDGLMPGGRVELVVARRLATVPFIVPPAGALWFDPDSVVGVLSTTITGDHAEFVIPALPDYGRELVVTAIQHGIAAPTGVLKSPAAVFRVRS